jgi:hypothetical protein
VLRYLGAYTHRAAISNHRWIALADGNVTFRWRDSAHGNKTRLMTLSVEEFLRRFLLHLLPCGFMRIRNFGFHANRQRAMLLPLCFRLLQTQPRSQLQLHPRSKPLSVTLELSGFAVQPCISLNGFLQLNPGCAPRLATSTLHEPPTAVSNHLRASARTGSLRLSSPRMPSPPSLQPRAAVSKRTISRPATAGHSRQQQLRKSSGPAQPYRNPIGSRERRLPSSRCICGALQNTSSRLLVVKWAPQIQH